MYQDNSVMQDNNGLLFDNLYKKYYGYIFSIFRDRSGNLEVAEDLTQETFIKIFRYFKSYAPEKGRFESWARMVAINVWLRFIKKDTRIKYDHHTVDDLRETPRAKENHTEDVDNQLLVEGVIRSIDEMPEPQRSYLIFRYVEQKKVKEIAKIYGKSESLMSRRIMGAIECLKDRMDAKNAGPIIG